MGKSTLFNRLAGERLAVIDALPGTTRDRLVAEVQWNGVSFDLVDTGGIETETGAAINLYFDFLDRSNRRIIELIGTEGTAIWDLQTEHSLRLYHSQQHQNTFSTDKFDWDSCYQLEIAEFFGAIANDELIESDGWNGLDTQYVLEMAMTSNKSRTESSR